MRPFRFPLLVALAAAGAACSDHTLTELAPETLDAPALAPLIAAPGEAVPGSYIVVLKEGADPRSVAAVAGVSPLYVYESALNGFAGTLNKGQLAALRSHPGVDYVEEDQVVRGAGTQSMNADGDPWGLDRINQRDRPLDGQYGWGYTGYGVYAYIIDSGIDSDHPQFEGRARNVHDNAWFGNGEDCHGHGTHVAGTVGAKTWGVAKKVRLRGVKVLNCNNSGTISGFIQGVDWVKQNHVKPAVANLSLGGGNSSSLNSAVRDLSNAGVFVTVAAMNENDSACDYSPAAAGYNHAVTTVAASTKSDYRASYSNYGSCVDLYAPGSGIKSAKLGGGSTYMNGTSMAAPHVAGVAALIKHRHGDISSGSVWTKIHDATSTGKIRNNPSGTPNRLLYKYATYW